MFGRDPFNVASPRQSSRVVWLVAGLCVAAAAVVVENRRAAAVQPRAIPAVQTTTVPVPAPRSAAAEELEKSLRVSWAGMFEAIEAAGKKLAGRVAITSLAQADGSQSSSRVRVTGLAFRPDALVQYVGHLQAQPGVRAAALVNAEPVPTSSPPSIRFVLDLAWDAGKSPEGSPLAYPSHDSHLVDIRTIFDAAVEERVALGAMDSRSELLREPEVLLKHVQLHIEEEYPRVKSMLARVMAELPQMRLDRIDIAQLPSPPAQPGRVKATAWLTLVYRTAPDLAQSDKEHTPHRERLLAATTFNPFGAVTAGEPAALGRPKVSQKTPPAKQATPVATAAPEPAAPPLPFTAIGSLSGADVTGGQSVAFLQHNGQLLAVRSGHSIDNTWRVEAVTAQKVEFVYLPLMQRQSLPLSP
jgi:hypothetical protein